MLPTVAVLTMTRARHSQLLAQVDGLSLGSLPPDLHVVVSMGDRDLTRGRLPLGTDRWTTIVRPVQTDRRALPLAAARNRAARIALDEGADVLVFMNDDIIPGAHTLESLVGAVVDGTVPEGSPGRPVLWCAPVLSLRPAENPEVGHALTRLPEQALPTPGTPQLTRGQVRAEERLLLFRGSCFAMGAEDFSATGGYSEGYTGHCLEDYDFVEIVRTMGGSMVWVGGADSYRQPTTTAAPGVQADHAMAQAQVWRERWGAEPDHPWLSEMVADGLLRRDPDRGLSPTAAP